nr:MAG TPA: hypothetical protein [Caudoviricetes sp.]
MQSLNISYNFGFYIICNWLQLSIFVQANS